MNQPLTNQQLDQIEARRQAATAGPWGAYTFGGDTLIEIAADLQETDTGYRARREICRLEDEPMDNDPQHREWTAEEDWAQVQADAAFIAHAPQDVDVLLAEVRRLRDVLTAIRHLHKDSPMGPCPVCIDADAVADGRDGLMPYPCPTGRLAGAQDFDPPHMRAAAPANRCGATHHRYPETVCTEPAGHYQPDRDSHAGPLVLGGREAGAAVWDEPAAPVAAVSSAEDGDAS